MSGTGVEVRHASDTNEHFTPPVAVEPARDVLGSIDLDPASCSIANRVIRATRIFTKADNGLGRPWSGRVWLNCPGGYCDADGHEVHRATKKRKPCTVTGSCGLPPGHAHTGVTSAQKRWWFKLADEYAIGNVDAAVWLGFSVESLQTTQSGARPRGPDGQPLPVPLDFPLCIPRERIAYVRSGSTLARVPQVDLFGVEDLLGEGGDSPPHSSYLVFLPPRVGTDAAIARFKVVFEVALGKVKL